MLTIFPRANWPSVYLLWSNIYSDSLLILKLSHLCFVFGVLGFELRDYTLSHSTSPFSNVKFFSRWGLKNYLPRLTSNGDPPDLCLLSS
jgi:hypothetical protein